MLLRVVWWWWWWRRACVCGRFVVSRAHHPPIPVHPPGEKAPSPMAVATDPFLGSHWGVQRCSSHPPISLPPSQHNTTHTRGGREREREKGEVKAIKNPRRPVNRPALGVSTPSHTQLDSRRLSYEKKKNSLSFLFSEVLHISVSFCTVRNFKNTTLELLFFIFAK